MSANSYTPEWERADCPTRGMSQADMVRYYKRTAALGDARFYAHTWASWEFRGLAADLAVRMAYHADRGKPIPTALVRELRDLRATYWAAQPRPANWIAPPEPEPDSAPPESPAPLETDAA
jgi:hypothetical protein